MTARYKYTMPGTEGPNLTSLRCLLFFFFGGIGCLLPFLSLHSRSIGFTLRESQWLSVITPVVAFFGPVIAGPLVDHFYSRKKKSDIKFETNSCIRFTLSSTILLSVIFYSLLLSVPLTERQKPKEPKVTFACSDRGASLLQERCHNELGCYQYKTETRGMIKLTNCTFDCSSPMFDARYFDNSDDSFETEVKSTTELGMTEPPPPPLPTTIATTSSTEETNWLQLEPDLDKFFGAHDSMEDDEDDEDFGSGEDESKWMSRQRREEIASNHEPSPPHICFGSSSRRMCSVFTPYSDSVLANITIHRAYAEKEYCFYPLGGHFSCRIPADLDKPTSQCKVVCDLKGPYVTDSVLQQSQCLQIMGDAVLSFWIYLTFRALGDLFTSISISLLIGAILSALRNKIGFEFVTPSVSYALFSTLAGYIQTSGIGPLRLNHLPPYLLSIMGFGFLSLISLFILIFSSGMTIGPPDWWTTSKTVKMRHRGEFFGLLSVLTLLGMLWGPYYFHVPWHISSNDAEIYLGSSVGIGALLSVIIVWKADFLVDFCGYSNLLITAFTIYILRYTSLLFINIPYILFLTSSFELLTLTLMFFSAILYIRHLVPKHLTFTAQSLGFAAHFCLGNGIGCLIATLLSPTESELRDETRSNNTLTFDILKNASDSPYRLLYCIGAVFAAVSAAVYFVVYHCCFKNRCVAPTYTKTAPNQTTLVQGSNENGTFTPLIPLSNGNQNQQAD